MHRIAAEQVAQCVARLIRDAVLPKVARSMSATRLGGAQTGCPVRAILADRTGTDSELSGE